MRGKGKLGTIQLMPHEPKKRHSRARKGKRRASIRLTSPNGILCPNCKAVVIPHTVCKKCGYYDGKEIVRINKTVVKTKAQLLKEREKEKDIEVRPEEKTS